MVYCPTMIMKIGHIIIAVTAHSYNDDDADDDDAIAYFYYYLCYILFYAFNGDCNVLLWWSATSFSGDTIIENTNMPINMNALNMA